MEIDIPTPYGTFPIQPTPGKPVVFLGPNGTGKSRLGMYIDDLDETGSTHRIGAQRSLELPQEVFTDKYERAISLLRRDKSDSKRARPSPGSMEYNYDELLMALFAERLRSLELAHEDSKGRKTSIRPVTVIDKLQALWAELLPHQSLHFSEATVRACRSDIDGEPYDASEMSDGERLVLYILGQVLLIETGSLLIVDEPELHMNRALLVRLWDLVERTRTDCSFIFVTHDIDFAASRRNAQLFAVLDFKPPTFKEVLVRTRTKLVEDTPPMWTIEQIPSTIELPRDLLVRMVGSRKPILFVEGKTGGLDALIYQAVYANFTVIPVGSCAQVIQLVRSFRSKKDLHWLDCAGIVDLDNRVPAEDRSIEDGVYALPVLEIENLLLVSEVFCALALELNFDPIETAVRFEGLKTGVLSLAAHNADHISLKYTSDIIWEAGKSIGAKAANIDELSRIYSDLTSKTNPGDIYQQFRSDFQSALDRQDFETILVRYHNKRGLMDLLGKALDLQGRIGLENFASRLLVGDAGARITAALASRLPTIMASDT